MNFNVFLRFYHLLEILAFIWILNNLNIYNHIHIATLTCPYGRHFETRISRHPAISSQPKFDQNGSFMLILYQEVRCFLVLLEEAYRIDGRL